MLERFDAFQHRVSEPRSGEGVVLRGRMVPCSAESSTKRGKRTTSFHRTDAGLVRVFVPSVDGTGCHAEILHDGESAWSWVGTVGPDRARKQGSGFQGLFLEGRKLGSSHGPALFAPCFSLQEFGARGGHGEGVPWASGTNKRKTCQCNARYASVCRKHWQSQWHPIRIVSCDRALAGESRMAEARLNERWIAKACLPKAASMAHRGL